MYGGCVSLFLSLYPLSVFFVFFVVCLFFGFLYVLLGCVLDRGAPRLWPIEGVGKLTKTPH